jgi:acetylornithine deacetylase
VSLTAEERRVCEEIETGRAELIALASKLVGWDTTARLPGDPPRDEAALQRYLADCLGNAGAEVDLWEPSAQAMAGKPLVPSGLDFAGRPQMVARFAGGGRGRSLFFNGHIDAVSVEPRNAWSSDPFGAEIRDGKLYGRGACDMKGGVAAMVFAALVLARLGIRLAGDLIVATNTDEESSGAGASAIVERGIQADAGVVAEPTGFDVWVSCRGSEYGVMRVPGRPGHAEVHQPHWRDGGAVNAIEKAAAVIDAVQALREEWAKRPEHDHPYLSAPGLLPTMAKAGEWQVSYPASCDLTFALLYLPVQADEEGWGSGVRREVEEWIAKETAKDDWLREHPVEIRWWDNPVMPLEIPESEPVVDITLAATEDIGRRGKKSGLDSWYDGATFTRYAGIPSIAYGPSGFDAGGMSLAHTIDEYVPVDDLVDCARGLAVTAMRFCGVASS